MESDYTNAADYHHQNRKGLEDQNAVLNVDDLFAVLLLHYDYDFSQEGL